MVGKFGDTTVLQPLQSMFFWMATSYFVYITLAIGHNQRGFKVYSHVKAHSHRVKAEANMQTFFWCLSSILLSFLPSTTKLQRLCFYRCVVCPQGGWYPSMTCNRSPGGVLWGCLVWGRGAWSGGGVPGLGGLVSQHALRQTPLERRLLLQMVCIHWNAFLLLVFFNVNVLVEV